MHIDINILQSAKREGRWRLILASDTTFGGEVQLMGIRHERTSGYEVAWRYSSFYATYERNEKLQREGKPLPTEPLVLCENRPIEAPRAEAVLESLSRIHVPLGRDCNHAIDDGCIQTIFVSTRIGHAELEWNMFVPEGWESVQQWFAGSWNQMRGWLALAPNHPAWKMNDNYGEGPRVSGLVTGG